MIERGMNIESELVMNWNVVIEIWVVYVNCKMLNCNGCDVKWDMDMECELCMSI